MRRKEDKSKLLSGRNLVALFIILTMVFSVLGYMMGRDESEETFEYNGYTFKRMGNQWRVKVGEYKLTFFSDPRFVEHINLSSEAVDLLKNSKMIYLTYNNTGIIREDVALMHYTISDELWKWLNIYLAQAVIQENEYNFPIISCDNATPSLPVIFFRHSNNTGFTFENNCLRAEVKTRNEVYGLADRLLFSLFGIMK